MNHRRHPQSRHLPTAAAAAILLGTLPPRPITPDEASAKVMVIDAIVGAGFGTGIDLGDAAVQEGLAWFAGNQHAMAYEWDRKALQAKSLDELTSIYSAIKEAS